MRFVIAVLLVVLVSTCVWAQENSGKDPSVNPAFQTVRQDTCRLPRLEKKVGNSLADIVRANPDAYHIGVLNGDTVVHAEVATDSLVRALMRCGCYGPVIFEGEPNGFRAGPHDCHLMGVTFAVLDSLGYGPETEYMYLVKESDGDWVREWLVRYRHAIRVDHETGDTLFSVSIKLKSDDTSELEALGINCMPMTRGSGWIDVPVRLLRKVRELPSVESMRPVPGEELHIN